ncbi:hypothetical protein [Saccharopolyspora griseoalba]|uniref:Uncharacterized protein n=1 Tax=Saccharopolyspora griseoalba TaxID=1431848 RepID=A0ABW2LUC6_9PSEU
MDSGDFPGLIAHGKRVRAMCADPELTGELLAVGVAMSAILDVKAAPKLSLYQIHILAFGPDDQEIPMECARTGRMRPGRAGYAIRGDARRYAPPYPEAKCLAPTPRKKHCGRKANHFGLLTDWSTGEQYRHAACNRHREWYRDTWKANQEAKPEDGGPLPYANTGGVLARHFPEVNWVKLWSKLDPHWEPYPERPEQQPAKPTLELVVDQPNREAAEQGDLLNMDPPGRPALFAVSATR